MGLNAKRGFACAVVAGSVMAACGSAHATVTVYTSQAAFNAAVSAPGVDTFDDLALTSAPSPLFRNAGPYAYTAAVSTTSFFQAGSLADVWLSTNTATDTVTFNAFGGGVQAAGGFFFGSNINGQFAAGDVTLSATDGSGTVTHTIVGATTASFVGFVSDGPLTSLTLVSVQPIGGFLWPTANDFVLAQAVPAPGVMALVGVGGIVASRRRRG